ncbi:unnamed protein product, partial [Adineta ricciae]
MSSSPMTPTFRKTRSSNFVSNSIDGRNVYEDFHRTIRSTSEFTQVYQQYSQSQTHRSTLISALLKVLASENVDTEIQTFIVDCLITHSDNLSDTQFKQEILPFMKQVLSKTDEESTNLSLSILRFLRVLVEYRPNILMLTLAEWLSCLLNFLVTHFSATFSTVYADLANDLFSKIIKQFTPLSKEIVDILGRSSLIISTEFLDHLRACIKNTDDIRLALFMIHLWQSLACLLSRLLIRGHPKGNEILAIMEDAFIVSNYSIRSAAFTAWSEFMSHVHHSEDIDNPHLNQRLLKLFLAPFLPDYTSKSKSASISKCQAWIALISIYPKNLNEIILPFLSFAFGNHLTLKTLSTTTAWWSECRQIGAQFLHDLLTNNVHGEYLIKLAGDEILNYLFDSIVDQLLENSINSNETQDQTIWLISWNAYLNHLIQIFKTNDSINEKQRVAINTCLLTRIEQMWIDSRIETRYLLKLFESFEHSGFPLAIETVLRDSSTRTKTLSAAQIHPASGNYRSQDKSLVYRTTLSDQYLHMMLEHAIRLNDEDQAHEEIYLHVISYLIDTLSKTSDENFCYQTSSLLLKCSVELYHQPLMIPSLFWHIWFRCSTHLINILNRSSTFELNNKVDNQKQDTSIELLLRPFAFNDIHRLDYSYTLLWTQLFKALCRLALINNDPLKQHLIHLLVELVRNEPAFEQAINDQHNQRLFGFILIIMKILLKTFSDIDLSNLSDRSTNNFVHLLSNTQKRSSPSSIILCFTQLSTITNHILQRLLSSNENSTQYMLVCCCLLKSNKVSSGDQTKLFVFTYIRDLIVDLFSLCKIYSHLDIVLRNLTQLVPFLYLYEQAINGNVPLGSSPVSIHKQQTDNVILNKVLSIISLVFEPPNGSSLLQLVYPILILAFQHNKTIMRNKARKCWNETFGRMTLIVYPNELRLCLRDLKDKEHLLLPCFLADHDNSNTAGSGAPPSSTDESQLSQQVDIATPLIVPSTVSKPHSSPARFVTPTASSARSTTTTDKNEPVFVPIMSNINYNNQLDVPVVISKRPSSTSACLTEKQKEKLRARHNIPLLCDDSSNTQSNSCTIDTPTIENMMRHHQLRQINCEYKQSPTLPLFKQTFSGSTQQTNTIAISSSSETDENTPKQTENTNEDSSDESAIAKKLRRSCRSSISVKKSLINSARKKEASVITTISNSDTLVDTPKSNSIKGILKRLSPTKPRSDHTKRVVFHDQVRVLVFASPSRRDLNVQQRKKSPCSDRLKSPTRIIPKENLPLRKQPTSARRLSAMNPIEQISIPSPASTTKTRSSKLFHPNDALADWTQTQEICQISSNTETIDYIFPSLIDCNKSIDSLTDLLSENECANDILNHFQSINIGTVGDLARLSLNQIEMEPILSSKLVNLRRALAFYQERLIASSSTNTIDCSLTVRTTMTSDESMIIDDSNQTTNLSSMPIGMATNPSNKLYDVETLINSLDCEQLDLNDEIPLSTHQITSMNDERFSSPSNRRSSPMDESTPTKQTLVTVTLGDRLQNAADLCKTMGSLPFNDDYIELVRQLITNC